MQFIMNKYHAFMHQFCTHTFRNKISIGVLIIIALSAFINRAKSDLCPLVVNTWPFTEANDAAWQVLTSGGSSVDAVEAGCSRCENLQCDGSVGFGNHPDENNKVTLDAMLFDGVTHKMGCVASLEGVKNAISVARAILEHSEHTLLVGPSATQFALQMGFTAEKLETNKSFTEFELWKKNACQPNYWMNVKPNPKKTCGPYKPILNGQQLKETVKAGKGNHDTIGMIAIDTQKNIAVGTSTNGMNHKMPGRVGDTAIPGSGGYVDNDVGAAVCTGDGDIIMRFSPAFNAVQMLSLNVNPLKAAEKALKKMALKYPKNMAAIVVANKQGNHGAACFGTNNFSYTVRTLEQSSYKIINVNCFKP